MLMNNMCDNLGLLLHDTTRLLRRRFEARATGLGLSSAQWRLLAITLREGRVTQARLAERLEIEPISVSRLVDRMEQAGWVARTADPDDRRIRLVVPTERALQAHAGIRTMFQAVIAEATQGFSATEQKTVIALLERMSANLSEAAVTGTAPALQEARP